MYITSSFKITKKGVAYLLLLLLVIVMVAAYFYWYEFRPFLITKECAKEAINYSRSNERFGSQEKDAMEIVYKFCLRREGIR